MRRAQDRRPVSHWPTALGLAVALVAIAGGCTIHPTPYQPLAENGGYEESRLQTDVYRVSFRGNRATAETVVLDYVFRRCAELTVSQGYSHFLIEENYGRTRLTLRSSGARVGVGLGFSSGSSFWGMGFGGPLSEPDYTTAVSYHLAIFVIRLLKGDETTAVPNDQRSRLYDAADLLRSQTVPLDGGPAAPVDR